MTEMPTVIDLYENKNLQASIINTFRNIIAYK
jgi:hypothetical protein